MNKDKVHHIDAITNQMKQGIGSDLVLEGISLSLLKFWMGETVTQAVRILLEFPPEISKEGNLL